jgi:Mn-dependent DtxR family transcriptional regulator
MLSRILEELKESGGVVNRNELSRKLGVERSALDGMIEMLLRQGRLKEITGEASGCSACKKGSCGNCAKGTIAMNQGKVLLLY